MSFQCDDEHLDMNGLLVNENTKKYRDAIKELLSKYYTWDEKCNEFDEKRPDSYRKYHIRAEFEDECCDDTYKTIVHVEVWLPSDEAATELANIIDGNVCGGLNEGCPTYCITYINKIDIKAKNKKEAEKIFKNMSRSELDSRSEFVKIFGNKKK